MYSPQDFLDALEQATPESKSKAIYALQEALQKQQSIIQACRELMRPDANIGACIGRIEKELKKYDRV